MKRPLTGLAVVYATGIWAGAQVDWPVGWLLVFAALVLAGFFVFQRASLVWAAVGVAGMVGLRMSQTVPADDLARRLERRDQNVELRGVTLDDEAHRFRMGVEAVNDGTGWRPLRGRVLVFVSESARVPELRFGDRVQCAVILRVPPTATNPGQFDWRGWLGRNGIYFTGTIRQFDYAKVLERGVGPPVKGLALRLREVCERSLTAGLANEPALAGVLAAMVLGERSEIPAGTYSDFQRTGVFHVFSISGLHVALVTGVVVAALRLGRLPRRWCAVVAMPVLVLFVLATGARPGALRALVMACVWLTGWLAVRPVDGLNTLGASALGILAVDAGQLWDGGFQMSFAAVWALMVIAEPVERWLMRGMAVDPLVAPEVVPRWRHAVAPAVRWAVRLVSCSVAAWVGLVPLMALYFNLFTPVSLLANVVVVPVLGFNLALGIVSMVVGPWWEWGAVTFNHANLFVLEWLTGAVRWLGQWRWGHWFVIAPPVWQTVAFYGLVAAMVSRRVPVWGKAGGLGLAVVVAGGLAVAALREEAVEVTVLDLPDGVAAFVNPPGTAGDFVVNGGSDWSGPRTVLPFLRAQGVDRLAAQMLTRGDKAHAAGLATVMAEIPVGEALHNGAGSRSRFFWDWLQQAREQGQIITVMAAGATRVWPSGLKMRVWHPPARPTSDRSDDNSTVWSLEYGPTRVVFAADIGATVERRLPIGPADILVKGRHALEDSATDEFLDEVQPRVVVQAAGTRPTTRYPLPTARERIRARGIQYLSTDETGAVILRLTRDGYSIRTCLGADAPLGKRP
jgi:competence protein ComEC